MSYSREAFWLLAAIAKNRPERPHYPENRGISAFSLIASAQTPKAVDKGRIAG